MSLFCWHRYVFIRNIYGDEINYYNKRSIYRCINCNKILYHHSLNKNKFHY